MVNGPSSRALREGGIGGSIPYKVGVTLVVKPKTGGSLPPSWKKKTTLQAPFGDYGQILRIDVQESHGCAYVEYEDALDARDAEKELNGKKIEGKEVSVVMAGAPATRRPGSNLAPVGPPGRAVDIEQKVAEMAARHFLDEAAAARLASVFQDRSRLGCNLERDFQELNDHLGASNKPSALVSMKLAELRAGRPIGPCKFGSGSRRNIGDAMEPDAGSASSRGRYSSYRSSDYFGEIGEDTSAKPDRDRDRGRDRERDRDRIREKDRRSPRRSRERDRRRGSEKLGREQDYAHREASEDRGRWKSEERKASSKSKRKEQPASYDQSPSRVRQRVASRSADNGRRR